MEKIRTDKNQVCLDLIETLLVANLQKEAVSLIEMLQTHEPLIFSLSAIYADIKAVLRMIRQRKGLLSQVGELK